MREESGFRPLSRAIQEEENKVQNLCKLFELQAKLSIESSCVPIVQKQCNFCRRNGEPLHIIQSHNLRESGRVMCPILRRYVCPLCGATGDQAHTISYCPLSNGPSVTETMNTLRKSCGCYRSCRHGSLHQH
ncbi:Nanos 2 [Mactra antiquata]